MVALQTEGQEDIIIRMDLRRLTLEVGALQVAEAEEEQEMVMALPTEVQGDLADYILDGNHFKR